MEVEIDGSNIFFEICFSFLSIFIFIQIIDFDIDNEFVQFALFLTKDKATLYINGVEKASVEYYIKNFRGFF